MVPAATPGKPRRMLPGRTPVRPGNVTSLSRHPAAPLEPPAPSLPTGRPCPAGADSTACRDRLRRRLAGRRDRSEHDAIAILLDGLQSDALDHGQLLGAAEGAIGLAVGDDRFGLG